MRTISIIDTTLENIHEFGVCGYKNPKKEGFPEKLQWLKLRFSEGLKIKTLFSDQDGTQGMIEYIPGKVCWRPVEADDYMFIHCLFVGFKSGYKNKGYASQLIAECEQDARRQKLQGVAAVVRKGSFMAGSEIFTKNGYAIVDSAKPDYDLVVKKFSPRVPNPSFKRVPNPYTKGLVLIRAAQCPYTVKNVREICETAEKEYKIKVKVVDLANHREAQNSPCPFGVFCMIYNGVIVADSPISNGRFVNIMKKLKT